MRKIALLLLFVVFASGCGFKLVDLPDLGTNPVIEDPVEEQPDNREHPGDEPGDVVFVGEVVAIQSAYVEDGTNSDKIFALGNSAEKARFRVKFEQPTSIEIVSLNLS